jgi:hypothetical protein
MEKKETFIPDTIAHMNQLYLKNGNGISGKAFTADGGKLDFVSLYRIDEVTFEEKAPRKEALENVIASMNLEGINFVYIIIGNEAGVSFYYGVARDFSSDHSVMEITDIGNDILQPSLQGNFRGSKITALSAEEEKALLKQIDAFEKVKVVEGVPGINKDDESFQSVDRLIDVMLGNEFAFVLIAKPLNSSEIRNIQDGMCNLYDRMSPLAKVSKQSSSGENSSTSHSTTEGTSTTKGTSDSVSKQESNGTSHQETSGSSSGTSKNTSKGTNKEEESSSKVKTTTTISGGEGSSSSTTNSSSEGRNTSKSESITTGKTVSDSSSRSEGDTKQEGKNTGDAVTLEIVNKKVQEWMKYLDEVILPRLDYGMGKGLFVSSAVIMGTLEADMIKLENTIRSIYGGEAGNRMPLKAFTLNQIERSYVKRFQIPVIKMQDELTDEEKYLRTGCSQLVIDRSHCMLGSWLSSKELSLFAGLPQKEVVGLALREEVEFGLNVNQTCENPVLLGHLMQSGVVLNGENGTPNIEVKIEKNYFDKHIFVTGVTGSGKTTTCQKLLLESNLNFMVIEPAKTEYRILTETYDDILVFTLGKETGAPFRLNPFEFFPGESITSRVDMIKASMEAAFDMEAAIPQILETAIYKCYENCGWDIANNNNRFYKDPFADGIQAFPTLGDLEKQIESVVKEQGFDERLKNDYIGSIKARLKGLTVGAKGLMLNTPRSISFTDLLDRKVVLELENIKSGSEKSLIMGFILANLSEAIREKYNEKKQPIKHITLVEEAHRLLSKFAPGDSMNKKQGVEMFSDMLAEVRKYGESLIIADQIPNKLTPEVLKNTNTKIVHKIFAQDDKEAIGNTMALKDEQKEHLSYLEAGSAIMMNPGLSKAIQLKIDRDDKNNTDRVPPEDDMLRSRILQYYSDTYRKGVLPGMELLEQKPEARLVDIYLKYFQPSGVFVSLYRDFIHCHEVKKEFLELLIKRTDEFTVDEIAKIIFEICYSSQNRTRHPELETYIKEVVEELCKQQYDYQLKNYPNVDSLETCKK